MSRHALLTREDHGALRILTARAPHLGDAVMSCLTVPTEFRRVQNEYPILFHRDLASGAFSALALFGFEAGENLFLEGGGWDARYIPLAMAIQPFLVGAPAPGSDVAQVHVDLGSPRISAREGAPLFGADGRPTAVLEAAAGRLGELDAGYRASSAFFAALSRHDLLEPFSLEVTLADGGVSHLVGYHVIDEARLRALDADALADLHGEGHLLPMFMAVASLSNLSRLIQRRNRPPRNG